MPGFQALQTFAGVVRAEGWPAVRDRIRDRWRESQWRVTLLPAGPEDNLAAPVLNVTGLPAAARLGGASQLMMARLRVEATERAVALLAPLGDRLSLDWWTSEARYSLAFPRRWSRDPLSPDPGWHDAVLRALDRTGARLVHVEGVAGLSLRSLSDLVSSGVPVVLSIYDFALYCRRPHLWTSDATYCGFCSDDDVCRRCLEASGDSFTIDQQAHRAASAALLERAAAVVCPTAFVRDRVLAHFPTADRERFTLIPPGIADPVLDERSVRHPNQIAVVGSLQPHKGGVLAVDVVTELAARGRDVTVYGGNGHESLRQLRGMVGVEIRGYYREGTLPALLVQQAASVALILSQVPETFALVLSEAWAAGVPAVTSGMGALGERLEQGGGRALGPGADAMAFADAVDALRATKATTPAPATDASAAAAHTALYLACLTASTGVTSTF